MTNQHKIAEDAREARELGMTYGAYKALQAAEPMIRTAPPAKAVSVIRKCAYCGREFRVKGRRNRIYCSDQCCIAKQNENRCDKKHKQVSPTRTCVYCGKSFPNTNGGKRYCSIDCKTLAAINRKKNAHPDGNPK